MEGGRPLSIFHAGQGGPDDAPPAAAEVAVQLGDLHSAVVLLHESARRLDARGGAEQELERQRIAHADEERLRRTADRAAARIEELVDELERADQRIAELEAMHAEGTRERAPIDPGPAPDGSNAG